MMTEEIGQEERINRICYIEPNDVFGSIDGTTVTPPYEDFSLSFDLIVKVSSRLRSNTINGTAGIDEYGDAKYVISWTSTPKDKSPSWVTFMSGKDVGSNTNSLTTEYTDISFDHYFEGEVIEGLGVERVDVSFESWYTPSINIKFVDLRGSSFFGREEAIHYDGKITADNIFGCFATFPYPEFKLQIKGFLGKPVTYQLACSNFQGELNPSNGNFEFNVSFIGYNYALLTDIPFDYLIASPKNPYVGVDYWNQHKSDKSWAMLDGNGFPEKEPIMLSKFFEEIENAQEKFDKMKENANEEANDKLNSSNQERTLLTNILDTFNKFQRALIEDINGNFLDITDDKTNNRQIILFSDSSTIDLTTANVQYEDFLDAVTTYNSSFTSSMFADDKLPNGWKDECPLSVKAHDSFIISSNNNGGYSSVFFKDLDGKEANIENVKNLVFNEGKKLTEKSASTLLKKVTSADTHIRQYCYIIDCGNLINEAKTRLGDIKASVEKIQKDISKKLENDILSILSFRPYIGNVMKLIFCHLETFCHIMYEAGKDIQTEAQNGLRDPSVLNIDIKNDTDFSGDIDYVPAWVGTVKYGALTNDSGEIKEDTDTFCLPSDYSENFIEMKVVNGFKEAIQTFEDEKGSEENRGKEFIDFPINTGDFNDGVSIFNNITNVTLSELSGYLSIRAAQLIGIQTKYTNNDTATASLLGKIDALNYYNSVGGIGYINGNIFNVLGNNNVVDVIEGISECNPLYDNYGVTSANTNKTRHKFETALKIDGIESDRHPFFKDEKYVHFYTDKNISLVPSVFKDFESYRNLYTYNIKGGKAFFIPKYITVNSNVDEINDTLYKTDTIKIKSGKTTVSHNMFNIFTNAEYVNGLMNRYEQINSGSVKVIHYEVGDDEGLKTFIDKFWKVGNDRYSKFFKAKDMLSSKLETIGVNTGNIFLSKEARIPDDETRTDMVNFTEWRKKKNLIEIQSDLSFKSITNDGEASVSADDVVLQNCKLYIHNNNSVYDHVHLFGSPFYYLQNNIKDLDIRRKVKSLLFLHTLKYDFSNILNVFNKEKQNGCAECVPYGYLLLLGGLLWRRKYGNYIVFYQKDSPSVNYRASDKNMTLFNKIGSEYYFAIGENNPTSSNLYNVPLSSLFGGHSSIDSNIEEQLIELFTSFSKNEFVTIQKGCEIYGRGYNNSSYELTASQIVNIANTWFNRWKVHPKDFSGNMNAIFNKPQGSNYLALNIMDEDCIKYRMLAVMGGIAKNGFDMLLNEDNEYVQKALYNVYLKRCIISDSNARVMGNSTDNWYNQVVVPKNVFRAYIKGFTDELKKIADSTSITLSDDGIDTDGDSDADRNLCIGIYYYLKNVWDKWLVGKAENTYDVSTFFDKNFIFIDAFYRNIYYKLPVNCEKFLDCYNGAAKEKSLFSFIGDLCKAHDCWFMAVPDFIHFTGEDTVDGHSKEGMYADINLMKDVFRPLPYNDIPLPENSNKFVIIYPSKPAEVPSNVNNFKYDGFDIWSHTDGFDVAPPIFKSEKLLENSDDTITRLGYKIPSFGVSFARQNQHIFKNIKVNMNNPVDTEQSIQSFHHLINVGKGGERKICFTGQDVFNIYSNYSYECEVEMLGNAQICPLMYFQLLNVPMWKGTYMIFKVTHSMIAGNMTTIFKGIKMCKYPKPFGTSFFVKVNEQDTIGNDSRDDNPGGDNNSDYDYGSFTKVTNPSGNWYYDKHTGNFKPVVGLGIGKKGDGKVNPKLVRLFNQLYEEIAMLPENKPKMTWNVTLSHVLRNGNGSAHCTGNAMDLNVAHYVNGKAKSYALSGGYQKELAVAFDILVSLHLNDIDQLLLEYITSGDMKPGNYGHYNVLHVGVKNKNPRHNCFLCTKKGRGIGKSYWGSTKNREANKKTFLRIVDPDFKEVAKKAFEHNSNTFRNTFIDYSAYSIDELERHFGKSSNSNDGKSDAFERWLKWTLQLEGWSNNNGATKHGYGIDDIAWREYHRKTGNKDYNYKNYYKWSWKNSGASKIKDDAVAILYGRAYFFIPSIVRKKITPSALNNMNPQEAFNKMLKTIANFMFTYKNNKGNYVFGDKGHGGWRKFLWYTKYNNFINVNNEKDVSAEKVKNYINSL